MRAHELVVPFSLGVSLAVALVACTAAAPAQHNYDLGQPADRTTLSAARVAIQPNGEGLPAGHGSVTDGERLYDERCANCHDSPAFPSLWGGIGSLRKAPQKTVGSYWPYAPIVYDYIRRAMPPQTGSANLSANELYALTAFIFYKNGLLSHAAALDASSLSRIHMPNRDGFFISDDVPDT